MKQHAVLAAIVVAFAMHAGTVTGRVLDGDQPVANASVELSSLSGSAATLVTRTDSVGRFSFRANDAGIYRVSVRQVGYEPSTVAVNAVSDGATSVTIQLHRLPQRLDSVVVVDARATPARYGPISRMDEFYERRAHGVGKFFTREQLDTLDPVTLASLLRRVSGARVSEAPNTLYVNFAQCQGTSLPSAIAAPSIPGAVAPPPPRATSAGAAPVALLIDGVQIIHRDIPERLAGIHVSDIEALEVYRSPTELPLQLMGNACGAIVIWTRFGADMRQPPFH